MKKLKAVCYSLAIAFALIMIPLAGSILGDILEMRDSYFAACIVAIGGLVIPLALLIYLTIRAFNNFWD